MPSDPDGAVSGGFLLHVTALLAEAEISH